MRRIHDQRIDGRRAGFTIIELIVAMAVVSVLASLLLPAVERTRETARKMQCQSNLRNLGIAMLTNADVNQRFPACGLFGWNAATRRGGSYSSWVVPLLPLIDQANVANRWQIEAQVRDPVNAAVAQTHIPLICCPADVSVTGGGDLSYVVNGGVGFTVQYTDGTHDCPVDATWTRLDLNGNGIVCPGNVKKDGTPSDKDYFFRMGLFFNETQNQDITVRHHRFASVVDGLSQTVMLSENVRTGVNPAREFTNWAAPNPYLTSFYIGNPCHDHGRCSQGQVNYNQANADSSAINSGLMQPEGTAPIPNSFHAGGVNMLFGDGAVKFVSQQLDGGVYAAIASPQGMFLDGTPLAQGVLGGSEW